MSRCGKRYRGPDGSAIPNLGQVDVGFRTEEGHQCGLIWQIAEVEKPLIAVSHLAASGHRVVLGKDGGEVVHAATGRKIQIHRKGGVYIMKMWIPTVAPKGQQGQQGSREASGFPRPGAA